MLKELLRFELRFHTRQPSFAAACLFYFGLGVVLTGTGFGAGELARNAPYVVTQSLGFASLFSIFAVAIFGSHALLRDADHRMHEIIFTTPIGRFHYLFSRFLGSFAAGLTVLSLTVAGMIAALLMPWQEATVVAPFDVRTYFYAFVNVVVPNLLFANAVLFATAARTRSALATYVASIFIYFLYFAGAALTNSPLMAASVVGKGGGSSLPALLDPFALSSFFHDTRYWTTLEKNTRLVPLAGTFLVNRLLCVGAAAAIWAIVHRTFTFRLIRRSKKGVRGAAGFSPPDSAEIRPERLGGLKPTAPPSPSSAARRWISAWWSASRSETRALLRNGPTIVLLLIWAALSIAELRSEVLEVEYGAALWPATSLLVGALATPLSVIGMIVIIYFSAEAFWRERQSRFAAIIDATPVRASALIAAKWTGMIALIATFIVIGILAAVVLQLSRGYTDFEPLTYLTLFYTEGLPLALYAASAILIHSLSRGKYLGMLLVLLFVIFTKRAQLLGLDHHLWRYATAAPVEHTAMTGFGHSATAFHWYMLLWIVVALLFLATAALRWRAVRRNRHALPVFAVLGAIAIAIGGWIFYNTTIVNRFETEESVFPWRASYERKYRGISAQPQPEISAIEANVDLQPEHRRYKIAGRYALINKTATPIRTIHVSVRRQARDLTLAIPSARLATRDAPFGMYTFALARPLLPGERTTLRYDLSFAHEGFTDEEADRTIALNGTAIPNLFFPSLGYRNSYELRDERERRKRGLTAAATMADDGSHGADSASRIDLTATISTAPDQIAITSGDLQRTWEANGRRYFTYRTTKPIPNQFGIYSGRYAKATRRHGDVEVVLVQHPAHDANTARIFEIAAHSLDYLEKNIGDYPHRQLHLIEVPGYERFGGFANPGVILLNEERVHLIDGRDRNRPDLLLRRVAHEIAHQWFGHQIVSANVPGGSALVESLTKYAELMILERARGRDQVRALLGIELDRYLAGRGGGATPEPPLYEVTGREAYVSYGKGALVLYAIRELIGEDAVNRALRGLMREQRPTTRHLLALLQRESSPAHYALIDEWFKRIVLYDLQAAGAQVRKRTDGRYDVTVRVSAAKLHDDRPVPMQESIEIGLFATHPEAGSIEDALHLQQHAIRSGMNEVTITVAQPPAYVAIDPRVLRIDRNRFDNVRKTDG